MLNVDNLNQYYGGSHILRNLSFTAEAGKVTAILGRNGVGKSTLLKSLMGLLPAKSGRIEFAGHDLTRAASHQRVKAGIGYVPQGREIFPRLTVQENLLMGLAICPGRIGFLSASSKCSRYCGRCCADAVVTSRVGSSSNSRLGARWRWRRNC